jgi:two-component system chemotaxis sensor kinase CheA
VRAETLDRFLSSVGEVVLSSSQLRTTAQRESRPSAELEASLDRMDRVVGDLQRRALGMRTAPLQRVFEPLPRLARELALELGKQVDVELRGAELELDRSILDRLGDPLVHLLRNAIDHGLESPDVRRTAGKAAGGRVVLEARRERDHVRIAMSDDGGGIDLGRVKRRAIEAGLLHPDLADDLPPHEIAALVFRPGLSTALEVSRVSGRGVGMDAVKATIESLGGSVELASQPGLGTTTVLMVPFSAAVQRMLLLRAAGEVVGLPISRVERVVELDASTIEDAGRERFAIVEDAPMLVIDLAERLGFAHRQQTGTVLLVLAEVREQRIGLIVERLHGQQEIYVKPLPRLLAGARGLAGLTVLPDGEPVFLLDLNPLA